MNEVIKMLEQECEKLAKFLDVNASARDEALQRAKELEVALELAEGDRRKLTAALDVLRGDTNEPASMGALNSLTMTRRSQVPR